MKKAIVTVVGKDRVGIISSVSSVLCQNNVNILDISQTIVDGFFNMMMVADTSGSPKKLTEIRHELHQIGEEIGCSIHVQHEDIFNKMHRI